MTRYVSHIRYDFSKQNSLFSSFNLIAHTRKSLEYPRRFEEASACCDAAFGKITFPGPTRLAVAAPAVAELGIARSWACLRTFAPDRRPVVGRDDAVPWLFWVAGLGGHARQVGYALHALPEDNCVPWHRVINARGEISLRSNPGADSLQRQLLAREGVEFDRRGRIDLTAFQWKPRRHSYR